MSCCVGKERPSPDCASVSLGRVAGLSEHPRRPVEVPAVAAPPDSPLPELLVPPAGIL